jgi:hypothetical protein
MSNVNEFLASCKGSDVTIEMVTLSKVEVITGKILLVEEQDIPTDNSTAKNYKDTIVSLLSQDNVIYRIPMRTVQNIHLKDAYLQDQLVKCLSKTMQSRKPVKKATGMTTLFITAIPTEATKDTNVSIYSYRF